MQRKITDQQIEEWLESPVTEYFAYLVDKQIDIAFAGRAEFLVLVDPVATHSTRCVYAGNEEAYQRVLDALREKDLRILETGDEIDESIRDLPDGRQSTH